MAKIDLSGFERVLDEAPEGVFSFSATHADSGVHLSFGGSEVRSTASVGKLLLLIEYEYLAARNPAVREKRLAPSVDDEVRDSGLLQHLESKTLPAEDLASLIAAVSDNLATNILLRWIGLDAVDRRRRELGLRVTQLHDQVRDHRTPSHPPRLSSGTSDELVQLICALGSECGDEGIRVLDRLSIGVDLSLMGRSFGLDPLAHTVPDRGLAFRSKTGCDNGVLADVGVASGPSGAIGFACIANWEPGHSDAERDDVISTVQALSTLLRSLVS